MVFFVVVVVNKNMTKFAESDISQRAFTHVVHLFIWCGGDTGVATIFTIIYRFLSTAQFITLLYRNAFSYRARFCYSNLLDLIFIYY